MYSIKNTIRFPLPCVRLLRCAFRSEYHRFAQTHLTRVITLENKYIYFPVWLPSWDELPIGISVIQAQCGPGPQRQTKGASFSQPVHSLNCHTSTHVCHSWRCFKSGHSGHWPAATDAARLRNRSQALEIDHRPERPHLDCRRLLLPTCIDCNGCSGQLSLTNCIGVREHFQLWVTANASPT